MRARLAKLLLAMLLLALVLATGPAAAQARRFVSINLCTDQLLLALADPAQILGLSPFARDRGQAGNATAAQRFPLLSGTAEEIMFIRPDVVLADRFTRRSTLAFLASQGIRVETFDPVFSLAESRSQILRVGELTGHPDRAAALVARIDASVVRAREAALASDLRVLPLQRRGWVAGRGTLMTSLLDAVGLVNAGGELAGGYGRFVGLEQIVALKADALVSTQLDGRAEDQGRAFLQHPALAASFPPERVILLPERLTVCGGPAIADALDHLTREIARLGMASTGKR